MTTTTKGSMMGLAAVLGAFALLLVVLYITLYHDNDNWR